MLALVEGSDDATVRVWNLTSKKCDATLEKHLSAATSMGITEDGWTLLTAGRDKIVNVLDLHDYSCKTRVPTHKAVEAVCVIGPESPFASILGSRRQQQGKKSGVLLLVNVVLCGYGVLISQGPHCLFEQTSSDLTVTSDEDEAKRGFISAAMLPSGQGLVCVTADQEFFLLTNRDSRSLFELGSRRLVGYNEEICGYEIIGQ